MWNESWRRKRTGLDAPFERSMLATIRTMSTWRKWLVSIFRVAPAGNPCRIFLISVFPIVRILTARAPATMEKTRVKTDRTNRVHWYGSTPWP